MTAPMLLFSCTMYIYESKLYKRKRNNNNDDIVQLKEVCITTRVKKLEVESEN